jgi:hypothetical protein
MPFPVALFVGVGDIFLGGVQVGIGVIVGSPLVLALVPSGIVFLLIGIAQIVRALRRRSTGHAEAS